MNARGKTFRYGYDAGDFVSSAFSGWLFAVVLTLFLNAKGGGIRTLVNEIGSLRNTGAVATILAVTVFFLIAFTELIALCRHGRRIVSSVLLLEYLLFASATIPNVAERNRKFAVLAAFFILLVPVVLRFVSTFRQNDGEAAALPDTRPRERFSPVLIFGIAVSCLFGSAVAAIGVMRYLNYSAPNFDFGIFCQMFENMAKTGAPVTTVERDGALSHFAVHASPILYLLLPFYFVFRTPITLAVGQAAILYSGIVPLLLIGRRCGLSRLSLILLSVAFAAYPAIGTGCFYDFHENCFLLPLLLWTFWFSECRRPIPFYLFALLTLTVKEDAFVYLVIFALFLLLSEGEWKTSLPLLLLSLGYFLTVSRLMARYGEGVMSWRYANLTANGEGLFGVILTVFTNPGYVMTQVLTTTAGEGDKFLYLATLLLPLGCLPCVTRRASRWILLSPLLLNLLTMYVYQPDVNFQYSFGIIAFLLYAAVRNLADLPRPAAFGGLVYSSVACVVAFMLLVFPMIGANRAPLKANREKYAQISETLDAIPKDASVCASSFFVSHLSDHSELYETYYHTETAGRIKTDCDYYVFDIRYDSDKKQERQIEHLLANGYAEYYRLDAGVLILVRPDP